MLIVSTIGTALVLFVLAIYLHVGGTFPAIITLTVAGTAFISAVGLLPLPYVLLGDLMPLRIRTMGITLCLCGVWLLAFALYMLGVLGSLNGLAFAYGTAAFCALAAVVVAFALPDTLGLSNDEIVRSMENKR